MNNDYHFITHWRARGDVEEVYDVLSDPLAYPRWWPSVYLNVSEVAPGDTNGLGRHLRLHTRGWLPYTIHWESIATEVQRPGRLAIRAMGEFDGAGVWTLNQNGEIVDMVFDWKLRAEKPLFRYLSFLLKPAFSANHRWAMARGQECLLQELARRRAGADGLGEGRQHGNDL